MSSPADKQIQAVVSAVLQKSKYRTIQPDLISRLAESELSKGRNIKTAVKEVSAKLHQVGAAYFRLSPGYTQWERELKQLPNDPQDESVKAFCLKVMHSHNSTNERLPILDEFFSEIMRPLAPIDSILDIACGLNPLALPWMPLPKQVRYYGFDIFADLVEFGNAFLRHFNIQAHLKQADALAFSFKQQVRLALLLKTLPCLEQLEKGASAALLEAIHADFLLVSFPIHSLGGKSKGMRQTYTAQFESLISGKNWKVKHFDFSSELAFLVEK